MTCYTSRLICVFQYMNIYILVVNCSYSFFHSFFNEISFATTGIPGLLEAYYEANKVDFCRLEASLACLGNSMNEKTRKWWFHCMESAKQDKTQVRTVTQ